MKKIALALVFALMFSACASFPFGKAGLEDRFSAYWGARAKEVHAEAFQYERMSLNEKFTKEDYVRNAFRNPVRILSFEMGNIKYENEDTALVNVEVAYTMPPIGGIEVNGPRKNIFQDKWVRINGKWYHVIKQMGGIEF